MNNEYDYIITGAGCAGLSLLMRLLQQPSLQHKKILVIDSAAKTENDRTWCFWEKDKGLFDDIVYHQWQQLSFQSQQYHSSFSISPYTYKLIKGIDFYNHVMQYAAAFPNVHFTTEKVLSIHSINDKALVFTATAIYQSTFVFNSILFHAIDDKFKLKQHFKGWVIKTEKNVFDSNVATFMDFTVSQHNGTAFMYVLPFSANEALVEFTMFTDMVLEQNDYNAELHKYIQDKLGITDFSVLHTEFGIIPMTTYNFKKHDGAIINIGTAGGDTKASSGYTFQFIQKRTNAIVQLLIQNKYPSSGRGWRQRKFAFYDTVLLSVLHHNKLIAAKIFSQLFKKNKPQKILQFLDNETHIVNDIKIISSLPSKLSFISALKEIFH